MTPLEIKFTRWVGAHQASSILIVTVLFIAISTGMSFVGIALWGPANITPSGQRVTYSIAVAIPLIMSPITFGFIARLLCMLDRNATQQAHNAATDALTGLLNRRGLHEAAIDLRHSVDAACIATLDVDDFTLINDAHGHEFGDKALVAIGEWLTQQASESGIAARIGGDEFVFIANCMEVLSLTFQEFEVEGVYFSVSIGTAQVPANESLIEGLAQADRALYETKNTRADTTATHRLLTAARKSA